MLKTKSMSKIANLKISKIANLKIADEIFFLVHCEKNSDGTKNLVLQGNDLQLRFKKRFQGVDVIKVTYFLRKFNMVTSLNLCYNNLGDEGFITLVKHYFDRENNLESLNLNYCDITENGILYFCNKVQHFNVRDLRLSGNKFGTEGGQDLALFLNDNPHIEYLDVGETDQTLSSVSYFMKVLNWEQGDNKTLKVLDLSRIIPNFNRYNYNNVHLADSISVLLFSNQSLIELHLQKCNLDGHDIELIVGGLRGNKTLLFLDIGYNHIGDHGIEILAGYLKDRPQLLGLNVAGNQIKDAGARELSFSMPYSRIRLLDIGNNKLSPSGILDLLYSIKKPIRIRILNLWGNTLDHSCNIVIRRMFQSGALDQKLVDVKIYEVDDKYYAAYNPSDRYKHKYYCELDYSCAVMLKIKRNKIENKPHDRVKFKYYPIVPGYESVKKKVVKHEATCRCCFCDV